MPASKTTVIELRDRAVAERWLSAGLCLMRMAHPSEDECAPVGPWIQVVLGESGALPPAGVIADIGHVVSGRSLRAAVPLPAVDARLRGVLRAYDDNVLARLEADPWLEAVSDVVVHMSGEMRARAVALLCGHLLSRLRFRDGVAISPGVVRAVMRSPKDELQRAGHAALIEGGDVAAAVLRGYTGLIEGARRSAALLTAGDVFLMENLGVLGELTQRMAIEQMLECADALARELPRRLKPRPRRDAGRIPTAMAAEASYPTGGFAAISTSGAIENLVISELIYMDEAGTRAGGAGDAPRGTPRDAPRDAVVRARGDADDAPPAGAAAELDLFDVRYAEGELLYYTRDESVFVRGRRVISFALLPDLATARFKDPAMPWQRLVAAFGLIACSVRKLAEWLDSEGLLFRVVFVAGAGVESPLAAERGLSRLILREFIERGIAEVVDAPDIDAVIARAVADARTSESHLIVIGMKPRLPEPALADVTVGALSLARPRPALTWAHRAAERARGDMARTAPATADGRRHRDDPADGVGLEREAGPRASERAWPAWLAAQLELLQEIV